MAESPPPAPSMPGPTQSPPTPAASPSTTPPIRVDIIFFSGLEFQSGVHPVAVRQVLSEALRPKGWSYALLYDMATNGALPPEDLATELSETVDAIIVKECVMKCTQWLCAACLEKGRKGEESSVVPKPPRFAQHAEIWPRLFGPDPSHVPHLEIRCHVTACCHRDECAASLAATLKQTQLEARAKTAKQIDLEKERIERSRCAFCGAANAKVQCAKCKVARYCNNTCATKHHAVHKPMCKKTREGGGRGGDDKTKPPPPSSDTSEKLV